MKKIPVVIVLFLLFFTGCSSQSPQTKAYYTYFDTVSYVYSYANDNSTKFEQNCALVEEVLKQYNSLLDIYHEYSNINNLCTINKMAGKQAVKVDPKLIDFLLYAKYVYEITDKETDITMGSVLSLWHSARTGERNNIPTEEELKEAYKHVGFEHLIIDREKSTVFLTDPKASLDAGAIGKGYAAEMAAKALAEKNVSSYVINLGGNIRLVGNKKGSNGFTVGIKNPQNPAEIILKLSLNDTSCVTSGNYERFFTVNGKNYSHIIDKDTLLPANYFASVSVITKDSALADALSTALSCMPLDKSKALADKLNVGCVWILNDNSVIMTDNLKVLE